MQTLLPFLVPLGIGTASGILAALCGVGGGVIMVPAFVKLLDLPQKAAVATSMAVIVPTAIAATTQHVKNGLVDWKVALLTALAATLTSFFVSDYIKAFRNETLTRIFAVVIIIFGVMMLVGSGSKPAAAITPPTDTPGNTPAAPR
jgi:uncharacterized membrane protein YfcA